MKPWDAQVREDHEALEFQLGALEAALTIDIRPMDRWVTLRWVIKELGSSLEFHMKKEEAVLFPALEGLLGEKVKAVHLLKEDHKRLRESIKHLAQILQRDEGFSELKGIASASQRFMSLLEEHEKMEDRLLIDVLEYSLRPKQLRALAKAFHRATQKASLEKKKASLEKKRPVKDALKFSARLVHP